MWSDNRTETIRSWKGEWVYALVIDRFHDGKERVLPDRSHKIGFGNASDLRKTCGGTLNGIRQRLPYIKNLGCTSILLTPFLENNRKFYHGYAIQDFLKVDSRFGTLEELKALINEAHTLGMRVIMDVVLNHTGDNWSYKKQYTPYRKGKSYKFSHWHEENKPQPLALRNEKWYSKKGQIVHWDNYPESWDGDIFELKDLVWDDTPIGWQVLECMVGIYSYWMEETGVDGFRLDALKHIRPFMANAFCKRIKEEAVRLGKEKFILIGEVVGNKELIGQYTELHGFINFPFYFDFLQNIRKKNIYGAFDTFTNDAFLAANYLDNHDQIGLEPKKRISDLLNEEQLLGCLALMGLQPGINCLYYGTEQGLKTAGEHDHDVRECLFDPYGELELCNPHTDMYQRISKTIHVVRKIVQQTETFKREEVNEQHLVSLLCYGNNEILLYRVVYNCSAISYPPPDWMQGNKVYSNYAETDASMVRPFELLVYEQPVR